VIYDRDCADAELRVFLSAALALLEAKPEEISDGATASWRLLEWVHKCLLGIL
jgi:hypothetical protein